MQRVQTPKAARGYAASILEIVLPVPFDEAAARVFGRIQSIALPKRGAFDLQIAAHALSLGVGIVTNNERDFAGVPELVVENWTRPLPGA